MKLTQRRGGKLWKGGTQKCGPSARRLPIHISHVMSLIVLSSYIQSRYFSSSWSSSNFSSPQSQHFDDFSQLFCDKKKVSFLYMLYIIILTWIAQNRTASNKSAPFATALFQAASFAPRPIPKRKKITSFVLMKFPVNLRISSKNVI